MFYKKFVFILLVSFCVGQHLCSSQFTSQQAEELLTLSWEDFDQTPGKGWRAYADAGDFLNAAHLIKQYLQKYEDLEESSERILHWHAGQMYAMSGDYSSAKHYFQASLDPQEDLTKATLCWNDYVWATLAFLDKDREKLEKHRNVIAYGPAYNGKKLNLDIVDKFLQHFNKTYREAYTAL